MRQRSNKVYCVSEQPERIYRSKADVLAAAGGPALCFDSEIEWGWFVFLKRKQAQGEIRQLRVHPQYLLSPEFMVIDPLTDEKTVYKAVWYTADFEYFRLDSHRVDDVKGMRTGGKRTKGKPLVRPVSKMKARRLQQLHAGTMFFTFRAVRGRNVQGAKIFESIWDGEVVQWRVEMGE